MGLFPSPNRSLSIYNMAVSKSWFWANWYNINAGIGVFALSIVAAYWNHFDLVQRCIIANFGVMNLHHWEEFGFPGGFAGLSNIARMGSDRPSHYPLNQLNVAFGNNWFNYVVYLPPLFFPSVTWLTLCPMWLSSRAICPRYPVQYSRPPRVQPRSFHFYLRLHAHRRDLPETCLRP